MSSSPGRWGLRWTRSRLWVRDSLLEVGLGTVVYPPLYILAVQEELAKKLVGDLQPHYVALLLLAVPIAVAVLVRLARLTHRRHRGRRTTPQVPAVAALPFPDQVDGLVGRDEELRRIGEAARDHGLIVVRGPSGMGTSTVAIRAAWSLAGDAAKQRYADLRGPDREHPEPALNVAQQVLRTLKRRPGAVQEAGDAAPYVLRALTGTGQVLLLDNVSTWSQVAWLPPRVDGAHIVVAGTLTDELPQHVKPIELGPLDLESRKTLLARQIVDARGPKGLEALDLLAKTCPGNPLELREIVRWLAHSPKVPVETLVKDLNDQPIETRMNFLLSQSVKQLRPVARHLFVLLAGLPIAEIDHRAAAALLGVPSAEDAIAELAGLGLVEQVRLKRIRVIGAFLDSSHDGTPRELGAWRRLVTHFADHAAFHADELPGEASRDWFAGEDRTLLQVLEYDKPDPRTGRALGLIADGLERWFRLEQRHKDRLRTAQALTEAAGKLGDRDMEATAELRQCAILLKRGDPGAAGRHYARSRELWGARTYRPAELHLEQAAILLTEGDQFTDVERELVHYDQALPPGDLAGLARKRANDATRFLREGQVLERDHALQAHSRFNDARLKLLGTLTPAQDAADLGMRAQVHESLALSLVFLGQTSEALTHLAKAESLYADASDEIGRGRCLVSRAGVLMDVAGPDGDDPKELVTLLEEAVTLLPPTGVSAALAQLRLGWLRRDANAVERHQRAGLDALRPWDGIAEPQQVSEIRKLLSDLPGPREGRPVDARHGPRENSPADPPNAS